MSAPPPAAQPPSTVAQPSPAVTPPVDQESIAKARETLHQQMKDLETQPPAVTAAPIASPKVSQPGQKPAGAKPPETASKPEAQPNADKVVKKPVKAATSLPGNPTPATGHFCGQGRAPG